MVAHDSNMWYTPSWELVPDTTRTDLGRLHGVIHSVSLLFIDFC